MIKDDFITVVLPNGKHLRSVGVVHLNLDICGNKFRMRVHVIRNLSGGVILGNEFLIQYKVNILYSQKIVQIGRAAVPFNLMNKKELFILDELVNVAQNSLTVMDRIGSCSHHA
eukprot:NODE_1160_length_1965_cov_0.092176.p1 type:complete len:114 gc:universal NODE_1160_length_1965_cov_0.092176:1715-1374(-)